MNETHLSQRDMRLAQSIHHQLSAALTRRKLLPAFSELFLTHLSGMTLLILVLDTAQLGNHSPYTSPDLLHQLSTDLGGRLVYLSNHSGIRYVVLLSPLPKLPRRIPLPTDLPGDKLALGLRFTGQSILLAWEELTHLAVLGATGSGKSVFLQSLAFQAERSGMRLLLSDIDQTTFAPLENHPSLAAPLASTPADALALVHQALAECDRRAALFKSLPERPQKLSQYNALALQKAQEPLPRFLVVLDEASAVLSSLGGAKGAMGQALASLGWRGRKFGIHFVFAAQEFTKETLGAVREQAGLSLCFRVGSETMAARMGCKGASRIPESRPGLAISNRHGPLQTYYLEASRLIALPSLSAEEQTLFRRAQRESGGKMSRAKVMEWKGTSEWQARKLLETWARKGWVVKDANADNAFVMTEKTASLLSNPPTPPTASNPLQPSPTGTAAPL